MKTCKKCGGEMVFYVCKTARYWKCLPCIAKRQNIYNKKKGAEVCRKFRKTEKYKKLVLKRLTKAKALCGVSSTTTLESRKTEANAHSRYQDWTTEDELLVLSGDFTGSELAAMLGRTLRGIQRKRARLRKNQAQNNPRK